MKQRLSDWQVVHRYSYPSTRTRGPEADGAAALRRARRVTEKRFQAAVIRLATVYGWDVKFTRNSKGSPAGEPDLRMVRGKRLIYAELKTDNGRLTLAQQVYLGKLAQTGVEVFVWKPKDWPEIQRTLQPTR